MWTIGRFFLPVYLILALFLCGCGGKVQPKPFVEFHAAVAGVSKNVAAASLEIVESDKARLSSSLVSGDRKMSTIQLTFPELFAWTLTKKKPLNPADTPLPVPLYYNLQKAHAGMMRLNAAFSEYATTLEMMASKTYFSEDDAKAMAGSINANAQQAMIFLEGKADPSRTAILGVAASALMREYITNSQAKKLAEIIHEAEAPVAYLCEHMSSYLEQLQLVLESQYNTKSKYYLNELRDKKTNLIRKPTAKEAEAFLKINDQAIKTTELFKSLNMIYLTLPQAHMDLANPEKVGALTSISNLTQYALALHAQYEELKKENEGKK